MAVVWWAVRGSERPRNVHRSQSVMVSPGAQRRAVRPPHSEREREREKGGARGGEGERERDFWLDFQAWSREMTFGAKGSGR